MTSSEVQTLTKRYDRRSSRVLVRRITRPTRANLDYAAYTANSLLYRTVASSVKPGQAKVPGQPKPTGQAELFGGVVMTETLTSSLAGTPLSPAERARPLAFIPMVDYLVRHDAKRTRDLEKAQAAVRGETWGLKKRPTAFFQQITNLYLHRSGSQVWVKIEFEPWADLFFGMPDEDQDDYPEVYGQLRPGLIPPELIAYLLKDYMGKLLSTEQIHTWANELAAHWSISYNTDVVKLDGYGIWPQDTEPEVKAAVDSLTGHSQTIAIRARPRKQTHYTIFVLPGIKPLTGKIVRTKAPLGQHLKQMPVTTLLEGPKRKLELELKQRGGGSWESYVTRMAPLHTKIREQLTQRSRQLQILKGSDGFLFYRRSLENVVRGDIQAQPAGKNPLLAIVNFKKYLAKLGVDFLLVPIPPKAEVFVDKLDGFKVKTNQLPVLNPHGRKFLLDLIQAEVEVLDLLPTFLEARSMWNPGEEPLYIPQDRHWTDRGIRLAASLIVKRIQRYPWYLKLQPKARFLKLRRQTFSQRGDLYWHLPASKQSDYKPAELICHQVLYENGMPYEDNPNSPIVVLGDSYTGIFQRAYCRHAGITAHIAHGIGAPVDLEMSYADGPNIRNKLLRQGEPSLRSKRLVVWIFSARDFYSTWED